MCSIWFLVLCTILDFLEHTLKIWGKLKDKEHDGILRHRVKAVTSEDRGTSTTNRRALWIIREWKKLLNMNDHRSGLTDTVVRIRDHGSMYQKFCFRSRFIWIDSGSLGNVNACLYDPLLKTIPLNLLVLIINGKSEDYPYHFKANYSKQRLSMGSS